MLEGPSDNTGTGFGNTLNILSLKTKNGQTTTEMGSVAFNDVTSGDATNQSNARTLSELLLTDAGAFRLLFDIAEPGNGAEPITLNALSVTFYAPGDGDPFITIGLDPATAPIEFPASAQGTGIDDAVFRLNAAAVAGVQAFFGLIETQPTNDIQVGAAGKLTNASGGPEAFAASTRAVVPEPGTLAVLGAGLLGLGAFVRRRSSR
ncbi:MAG: PEP-CTERM sorting domain-containing protein [Geminicoccaceae bacterium]